MRGCADRPAADDRHTASRDASAALRWRTRTATATAGGAPSRGAAIGPTADVTRACRLVASARAWPMRRPGRVGRAALRARRLAQGVRAVQRRSRRAVHRRRACLTAGAAARTPLYGRPPPTNVPDGDPLPAVLGDAASASGGLRGPAGARLRGAVRARSPGTAPARSRGRPRPLVRWRHRRRPCRAVVAPPPPAARPRRARRQVIGAAARPSQAVGAIAAGRSAARSVRPS